MRAQIVVQEPRAAEWLSNKSVRSALLLGVLVAVSIAVNAMIMLAALS